MCYISSVVVFIGAAAIDQAARTRSSNTDLIKAAFIQCKKMNSGPYERGP